MTGVTVLRCGPGHLATKRWVPRPGGKPYAEPYKAGKWFRAEPTSVGNIRELSALLKQLERDSTALVIRGEPVNGLDLACAVRRTKKNFREPARGRPYAMLDFDKVEVPWHVDPAEDPEGAVEHLVGQLGPEFQDVTYGWQLSSSAGMGDPGRLSAHVWFWFDRDITDSELKDWAKTLSVSIDQAPFNEVQAHYTAAPLFAPGLVDSLPRRSGLRVGLTDAVAFPAIGRPQRAAHAPREGIQGLRGNGGYEAHLDRLGNGKGLEGFHGPLRSAVMVYVAAFGKDDTDAEALKELLRQRIVAAPRLPGREAEIDRYKSDEYLDQSINGALALIASNEPRSNQAGYGSEIEPTYPAPAGEGEEGRAAVRAVMHQHLEQVTPRAALERLWREAVKAREVLDGDPPKKKTREDLKVAVEAAKAAYIAARPQAAAEIAATTDGSIPPLPRPPTLGLAAPVAIGKTKAYRDTVATGLVKAGLSGVLAVPRHKLGSEIVADLAEAGITARDYRGREADDPEKPGEQMCRDLERVTLIEDALGDASRNACKRGADKCEFFDACGYQRQRAAQPDIWIIPHQLLFRPRPSFVPPPASLGVDESFWQAALHGCENPVKMELAWLAEHRTVPRAEGELATHATADLIGFSLRVRAALSGEAEGNIRREAIICAGITPDDARLVERLTWRCKVEIDARPGQPLAKVKAEAQKAAKTNKIIDRLARFWKLLAATLDSGCERSPWLTLDPGDGSVAMAWREDIHPSWTAPTLVMDATLPAAMVAELLPQIEIAAPIDALMPAHVHVRQISDRAMTGDMLIPTGKGRDSTRLANIERLSRYGEVMAADAGDRGAVLICQKGVEEALRQGPLPKNLDLAHYNDITGVNDWSKVEHLSVVGRTQASPRAVERIARVFFGVEVTEIEAVEAKNRDDPIVKYEQQQRAIRMKDGRGIPVFGPQHPDPRVEAVRWQITEGQLIQAIGRGRGINRGPDNPLRIDIVTNVVLPIEVDEMTTWGAIQPDPVEVMRVRGAVPVSYADMATAYPDLFASAESARKGVRRSADCKNPGRSAVRRLLTAVLPGFLKQHYRRKDSRGPSGVLLYDPALVGDPLAWLSEKLGAVVADVRPPLHEKTAPLPDPLVSEVETPPTQISQEPVPTYAGGLMSLSAAASGG